jgi:hypothetical protein
LFNDYNLYDIQVIEKTGVWVDQVILFISQIKGSDQKIQVVEIMIDEISAGSQELVIQYV